MENIILVSNIKTLCAKNNISVSQLEKELNLSNGLISRWKEKTPTLERLIDIAQRFEVTLDDLIGGTIVQEDADPRTLHLIRSLIQETQKQKMKWSTVDINDRSIKSLQSTYDVLDKDEFNYYCAIFEDGCFLIGCLKDEPERKMSLYVVPDYESYPYFVCSNDSNLFELFDLIINSLKDDSNKIKAYKYIDYFLSKVSETLKPNSLDKFRNENSNRQIYKIG